jgi:hypothetical protein
MPFSHGNPAGLSADRDYYRLDEKGIVADREKYRALYRQNPASGRHTGRRRQGRSDLQARIRDRRHPLVARRNGAMRDKTYNPMAPLRVVQFAPISRGPRPCARAGSKNSATGERTVIVSEKSAFPGLASLFKRTSVDKPGAITSRSITSRVTPYFSPSVR